jgi:hypothetical protein
MIMLILRPASLHLIALVLKAAKDFHGSISIDSLTSYML